MSFIFCFRTEAEKKSVEWKTLIRSDCKFIYTILSSEDDRYPPYFVFGLHISIISHIVVKAYCWNSTVWVIIPQRKR